MGSCGKGLSKIVAETTGTSNILEDLYDFFDFCETITIVKTVTMYDSLDLV